MKNYLSYTPNRYSIDGMNRLTREYGNGADIRYSYDKFGNRTLMSVTGAETYTTSYTYDKNNRLLQESKQAQTGTESMRYYYDPNGNQTCQQILAFGSAADGQLSSELLPAKVNRHMNKKRNSVVKPRCSFYRCKKTYKRCYSI